MFESERQERPAPTSPGQTLLRHLEHLRVQAEERRAEHSPEDLDLPAICAHELGLAGLVLWRAHEDDSCTCWELGSRETLVWHRVGRLWTCWPSVERMNWSRQDDRADRDAD
jgi:hypothetical protein